MGHAISTFLALSATIAASSAGYCQSTASTSETVLDPSPFATCRASSMGGALSTIADQLDAIYYNPAGIGRAGFDAKKTDAGFIRALYFPYAAVSLNQNAGSTRSEFNAKQAQNDANTGAAILNANSGKRQYARASIIPLGILFGSTAVVPLIDHQLAAVPEGDGTGQVKLKYRSFSGLMFGASVADRANVLSLGVSQAYGTIEETSGTFSYLDMVDSYQRKKILNDNRKSFIAQSMNVGMTIRVPKASNPAFSLVARNFGNTKNKSTTQGDDPLTYDEDLTLGFSVSPAIGKIGRLNVLLEGGYLTQQDMATRKKLRGGMEILLGGSDSQSLFGLRLGGNDSGWSGGFHINLGLIGVEAETHGVDVGVNNQRMIERRTSAIFYINLGSI